ncbi:MAG: flagellar export chaperone FlgN [Proteobacteria bacterium]|nr:flagellar export chaperone FlgN [Pseudomonadota bacterium]MDE3208740.1 flagellar protein FlgN [Pseudomonadota bacterium]
MSYAPLANVLAEEQAGFLNFLALLEEEHVLLVNKDSDALAALLVRLDKATSELAELAQRRRMLMQFKSDRYSFDDVIDWMKNLDDSESSRLIELWKSLVEIAEQARLKHLSNGVLIETLAKNNAQAIQMLATASQITNLYGPDGKLEGLSSKQFRGQA